MALPFVIGALILAGWLIVGGHAENWSRLCLLLLFVAVFALVGGIAAMVWYLGHRRFPPIGYACYGGLALLVVLLAAVGYAGCADGRVPGFSHAYHGLRLLLGDVPEGCEALPLTAELARYLGLAGVLFAAIQAVLELTSNWISAGVASLARRVSLVVGLNDESLPVVAALAEDRDSGLVVVLEADRDHPLIAQVKASGARVVIGTLGPGEPSWRVLRRIAGAWPRRMALQSVYLLAAGDGLNLARARQVEALLERMDQHRGPVPTRVVVRIDDYRVARHFAAAQCVRWADERRPTVLLGTLGKDQVSAHGLAHRIGSEHLPCRVIIVGESQLALALRDELGFLDAYHRFLGEDRPPTEHEGCSADRLQEVIAKDPTRACVIIFTDEVDTAALQEHASPAAVRAVFAPGQGQLGIAQGTVLGKVHHYGPCLGAVEPRTERTDPLAGVPADRWSRAAVLVHRRYDPEEGSWENLTVPDRHSNLRGIYQTARGYAQLGYIWGNEPQPGLSEAEYELLLDVEHESWLEFKRHYGWVCPKPGKKPRRDCLENDLLKPFHELPAHARDQARRQTLESIRGNVEALASLGFHPAPARYRAVGRVKLLGEVTEPQEWINSAGAAMSAVPGDLWIASGNERRSIKRDQFERHYRLVAGEYYERLGEVTARRAVPGRPLATLEGPDVERDGFWVLTDRDQNSWQVSDEYLARNYRRS